MKYILVQSDKLLSVGYDAELQVLEIEFSDHKIYQFISVTADVYASLMKQPIHNVVRFRLITIPAYFKKAFEAVHCYFT